MHYVRLSSLCGVLLLVACVTPLQLKSDYYEKAALELKTFVGDILQEDFRLLDLKVMLDNGLHCSACTLITEIINDKRSYLKFNRRYMDILLSSACSVLQSARLMSADECNGLINTYADTVLYLINNLNDTRTICPIMFQPYACVDVAMPDYAIRIPAPPPGGAPARRPSTANATGAPLRILHVTDVHYDPSYKPAGNARCMEHLCCMSSSGPPEHAQDRAGYWADYRDCDVPDYFIQDTFDHIARNDKFDYIYFTGDIIYHKLWATSKTDNLRDMYNFWRMFKDSFGTRNVFPALGNHEVHPCNLYPPPYMNDGQFSIDWLLAATATFWADFLPDEALATVRKGGYYSVRPQPGLRVIAINSNIGYYYNFWLVLDDQDPYGQLQWLVDELQAAEVAGEVVHILSHVPGGVEMASTWARKLRAILQRYHTIIGGIFNGHTHFDEFQVYYAEGNNRLPIAVGHNGGSLTPYSNVNPNYKIYTADSTNFEIMDYDAFTLNLTAANIDWQQRPRWRKAYSLRAEYDLADATPASMHGFVERLARDASLRRAYFHNSVKHGTPSLDAGCDKDCQIKLVCNTVTTVHADTAHCDHLQKHMEYFAYDKKK